MYFVGYSLHLFIVNIYVRYSKVYILIFSSVNIEPYKTVDSLRLAIKKVHMNKKCFKLVQRKSF